MKKFCFVLLGISIFTLTFFLVPDTTTIHAQIQEPPKPGPEQKKLEVMVGEWSYEGAEVDTPLGKKGNFSGKTIARMVANGFVLEQRAAEKSGEWLDLLWYDSLTKSYIFQSFDPSGSVSSGTVTVNGNTWIATGVRVDTKGQRVHVKSTQTLSPEGKTNTSKQEYSLDEGKTWLTWWNLTSKKSGK